MLEISKFFAQNYDDSIPETVFDEYFYQNPNKVGKIWTFITHKSLSKEKKMEYALQTSGLTREYIFKNMELS